MDVFRGGPGGVGVRVGAVCAGGGDGVRGRDDFDVETGAEGLHVRGYHSLVGRGTGGGEELGELGEAEGGEDGGDAWEGEVRGRSWKERGEDSLGVVAEVKVEGLV